MEAMVALQDFRVLNSQAAMWVCVSRTWAQAATQQRLDAPATEEAQASMVLVEQWPQQSRHSSGRLGEGGARSGGGACSLCR